MIKPFVVLAENASPEQLQTVVAKLEQTEGIAGAAAPAAWRKGELALVEAFPDTDSSSREARTTISRREGRHAARSSRRRSAAARR